ncbi:MAG: cytidine deaminase [Lentisphaeria bacterium]|nr:cytidine deaminase [Lentisphaeria bacterium]
MSEYEIWKTLYERANAVRKGRKLSPLMEVGSVGAAVLSTSGNIYTGICIDTACGMGMCAERSAIANMLTCGESKISKVAAVMPDGSSGTPCGVCREFMMQLGKDSGSIEILLSLEPLATVKLKEVMPDWWGQRYQEDE